MIHVNRLECDVVDTCNLKCKDCGHLSPSFRRNTYSFEEFKKDFEALSEVCHCKSLSLLGGEPLLVGKRLLDYVHVIRETAICDELKLVTNGILIERNPEILKAFDVVWISLYDHKFRTRIVEWVQQHRNEYPHICLNPKSEFAECFTETRLSDERAQLSWDKCEAKTSCNLVYRGHYFRCAPAAKFHQILDGRGVASLHHLGCNLHGDNLEERLKSYIGQTDRISTCYHCLGHLDYHPWYQTN